MDEALVGGDGGPHKELVLVAAEAGGRVRLAHAATNDKATGGTVIEHLQDVAHGRHQKVVDTVLYVGSVSGTGKYVAKGRRRRACESAENAYVRSARHAGARPTLQGTWRPPLSSQQQGLKYFIARTRYAFITEVD
jgi:hypothetical protein